MSAFTIVAVSVLLAQPAAETADGVTPTKLTLADVVKKVQKNEELYRTLEMRVREEYTWVLPDGVETNQEKPREGESGPAFKTKTTTVHVILDGERFLQEMEISRVAANSKKRTSYRVATACDGNQTRTIFTDPVHVIVEEDRSWPSDLWHPNTFPYQEWNMPTPFSKYLTWPDTKSFEMRWTVLGEEKVDGLRCVKLKFEQAYKDIEHVMETNTTSWFEAYFWLAVDRNYLPIRSVGISPRHHPTLDHDISRVTSLKEVKPGIWVPERGDHVAHDATELKKGMLIPDRRRVFQVQEVILGKQYDVEVFRPEIPEGADIQK